ncbi:MAG: hypothetical protein ACI4PQ_06745 [Butyricicoccaceae bacterium]
MKIERYYYTKSRAAWKHCMENRHCFRSEQEDCDSIESGIEAVDEALRALMPEPSQRVCTILNPKKCERFGRLAGEAIELAERIRANLLIEEEGFSASIILIGESLACGGREKQLLNRLLAAADDVAFKVSVDTGEGMATDIDGLAQLEFWFDLYEETELD